MIKKKKAVSVHGVEKNIEQKCENHGLIFWARVDAVIDFILDNPAYLSAKRSGELTRSIIDHINKQAGKELSESTARKYIREAKKEIMTLSKSRNDKKLQRAIVNRESLLSRVRKEGDYKTEFMILKDIGELQGLYPLKTSSKTNAELKNIDMSIFTDYGLERLKRGDDADIVSTDPKSVVQNDK
ncbi:MAG: hypothetical protein R6W90_07635 [Ignavibacteriaceae bacterium]